MDDWLCLDVRAHRLAFRVCLGLAILCFGLFVVLFFFFFSLFPFLPIPAAFSFFFS